MNVSRTPQARRSTNVRGERVKGSTSGAHYTDLVARAKANSAISPYCVPNEYICAEIGRFLRLPVAQGVVITGPGDDPRFWYAVLDFSPNGEPLPPVVPEDCWRSLPELCMGTVLFDIFIANRDRSESNLFFDEESQPPQLRLFDHEAALLGETAGQAEGRLTGGLNDQLGIADHCLKPLIPTQDLMSSVWMSRIGSLPDYLLEETCQEAAEYGMTPEERDALIVFLKKRRDGLSSLVSRY